MVRANVSQRWPSSPTELAKAMSDPESFAELFPNSAPGAFQDFAQSYIDNCKPLQNRIAEEMQMHVFTAARDGELQDFDSLKRPKFRPGASAESDRKRSRFYNKNALGRLTEGIVEKDHPDRPLAGLVWAMRAAKHDPAARALLDRFESAQDPAFGKPNGVVRLRGAMSERVPAEGGFLLPENLRDELLQLVLEDSMVRPRAHIVPMDSLRVPIPSIDDISHETTVYGGVAASWTEEGAALTATAPAWSRLTLEARKLALFTSVPNELLQDAGPLLEQWISGVWPKAIGFFEDVAFIGGSGVGEPQGFLNSPCQITQVCDATAHTLTWNTVVQMYARLYPPSLKSPGLVWMCSPDTVPQVLQLAASATVTTSGTTQLPPPLLLSGMQGINQPPKQILGIDLVVSEKMPSSTSSNTTTPGALSLVDLGQYVLGDRQAMQLAVSDEYLFGQDMVAYRVILREDGRTWLQAPLQPYSGGPTLSTVVLWDSTQT